MVNVAALVRVAMVGSKWVRDVVRKAEMVGGVTKMLRCC